MSVARKVERSEILDYQTYEDQRRAIRAAVMEAKAPRRIQVADCLTLLFENRQTVRYQIQEMIRAERIVREAEIQHEIDTYNELLGGPGELGATLLIELQDPVERDQKLREWLDLPEKMYVKLEDGSRVFAAFDPRQRGQDRVSSVQYFKFDTAGRVPVAVGVALPGLEAETPLTTEQREALQADLATD